MKLSIIIVNYNTFTLTMQTIDSLVDEERNFSYEIILVDNASKDGSIEAIEELVAKEKKYEHIHIIKNTENLGFAKANNKGMKQAKGEYILLLNSDTKVAKGCLEECIEQLEKERSIGALGCKVVLANGQLDHACKRGFPTPRAALYYFLKWDKKNPEKYGQYDALHLNEDEVGEVDALTGAFMLMPRCVLDKVGLLDEDFFMYGEDIDLCFRIKEAGYRILYYPKTFITHFKGGSSTRKRHKVIYDFHQAMWIFYRKHCYKKNGIFVNGIVFIGICLKCMAALIMNYLKPKKVSNKSVSMVTINKD